MLTLFLFHLLLFRQASSGIRERRRLDHTINLTFEYI
ncbi:hypothetical protein F383_22436 [Gossypium arboreum]|uniref:Uncharacterized protein n=1 Tax=Gossypium arboreum TaxID=29729 RepID=A0A0B0NU05_GOSAR|nr:hypothetical protein F383_04514 [Gossypium arboreum]KHG16290.1 hypothetical protein F383_22436 [Gossypium arboreum]